MKFIEIILYKYGLFKLTEKKVEKWHQNKQVAHLLYASKNGLYSIRLICIRFLTTQLENDLVKKQLINMIDDEVDIVANAAISIFNETKDKNIIQKIKLSRKRMRRNQELPLAANNIAYFNEPMGEFYNPKEKLMGHLKNHPVSTDIPFCF